MGKRIGFANAIAAKHPMLEAVALDVVVLKGVVAPEKSTGSKGLSSTVDTVHGSTGYGTI